jgi:hypothetical protein
MPSTFKLAPSPKWYFLDKFGAPAVGGKLYTYSSLDHVTKKPVYKDAGGLFPYDNPIDLDSTGGTPTPLYWEDNGVDLYYLVIEDAQGNLIIPPLDNYPITGGGGIAPITSNVDIENHLVNGQFNFTYNQMFNGLVRNNTRLPISPVPAGIYRVAPGGGTTQTIRDGLNDGYASGSIVDSSGKTISPTYSSGWLFEKTGGGAITDTITFKDTVASEFSGLPNGPTANAPRYFEYEAQTTAVTTKLDLIYVIPDVRTFAGQTIECSFDARGSVASGATEFIVEQNFGTGGAPSATVTTTNNFTFPNAAWDRIVIPNIIVPALGGGAIIGDNLDDRLILRWRFPINTLGNFRLTNMQIQIGTNVPTDYIYKTFNQDAYSVVAELIADLLPKTGDTDLSIDEKPKVGWVSVDNDNETFGTIASGATHEGEEVRNLYRFYWNKYPDALAPVSTGRGANADADFNANKTIRLPQYLGRVLAAAGFGIGLTPRPLGAVVGEENHTLTIAEIPPHTHNYTAMRTPLSGGGSGAGTGLSVEATDPTGGGAAHNTMQPTAFFHLHIKL